MLNKERKKYIEFSKQYHEKQKEFLNNLVIYNKEKKSVLNLDYEPLQIAKDNYLNILMRTEALQQQESDKIALFVTLTLKSKYHKYKDKNGKLVLNKNYKEEYTIQRGYKKLKKIFRKLQKDFYDVETNKKITFKNMRVIEYHKDFTPHLHGIIFVDSEHIEAYLKQVKKFFGTTKIEQTETKIKYLKNNNIGMSEIEILQDSSKVTAYLSKYIKKSINPKNEDDFYLLDGWRKKHKIRIFTISKVSLPRYIYKKAYQILGHTIKRDSIRKNMLLEFEDILNLNITILSDDDTKIKENITLKENALYNIEIIKIKYEIINSYGQTEHRYKIDTFIITNMENEILYNKDDYIVFTKEDFRKFKELEYYLNDS